MRVKSIECTYKGDDHQNAPAYHQADIKQRLEPSYIKFGGQVRHDYGWIAGRIVSFSDSIGGILGGWGHSI